MTILMQSSHLNVAQDFSNDMLPSSNIVHDSTLPSFLFQMLQDHDIDPQEVALVTDNAAISPNISLRQAYSAPCFNDASIGSHSSMFPSLQQVTNRANARWSPMGISPSASSSFSGARRVKPVAARALLLESPPLLEINETSVARKKANKKASTPAYGRGRSSNVLLSLTPPLHEGHHTMHKSASTDSMLEDIKPSRRASPSPSSERKMLDQSPRSQQLEGRQRETDRDTMAKNFNSWRVREHEHPLVCHKLRGRGRRNASRGNAALFTVDSDTTLQQSLRSQKSKESDS